jgi:hypothetical protein
VKRTADTLNQSIVQVRETVKAVSALVTSERTLKATAEKFVQIVKTASFGDQNVRINARVESYLATGQGRTQVCEPAANIQAQRATLR